MGLVWIDRRDAPVSRALRLAEGHPPPSGPHRQRRFTHGLPLPVTDYRQYLDGLARIHNRKGK